MAAKFITVTKQPKAFQEYLTMLRYALAFALLVTTGIVARSAQEPAAEVQPPSVLTTGDGLSADEAVLLGTADANPDALDASAPELLGLGLESTDAALNASASVEGALLAADDSSADEEDDEDEDEEDEEDEEQDEQNQEDDADDHAEASEEHRHHVEVEVELEDVQHHALHPGEAHWEMEGADFDIRVYRLQHARATDMARFVQRLFPESSALVDADERTNQLVVRRSPVMHDRILELIKPLDQPQPNASPSADAPRPAANSYVQSERGENVKKRVLAYHTQSADQAPGSTIVFQSHPATHPQVYQYIQQVEQGQQEMAILTDQIRQLRQATEPDKAALADLEKQLRERVAEAFDARQQVQRAELGILQQQLASIEQTIAARDRAKDQMVDKRVNDLLSGDNQLQWNIHVPGTGRTLGMPIMPPTPFGLPVTRPFPDAAPNPTMNVPVPPAASPLTPPTPPRSVPALPTPSSDSSPVDPASQQSMSDQQQQLYNLQQSLTKRIIGLEDVLDTPSQPGPS